MNNSNTLERWKIKEYPTGFGLRFDIQTPSLLGKEGKTVFLTEALCGDDGFTTRAEAENHAIKKYGPAITCKCKRHCWVGPINTWLISALAANGSPNGRSRRMNKFVCIRCSDEKVIMAKPLKRHFNLNGGSVKRDKYAH